MAHRLETVLEAAKLSLDNDRIMYLMVGDGAERKRLEELCGSMGLTNVMMLGQQPKSQMPKLWSMCDVSLVLLRRTDLFKTVIPSKIFEAMAMAKPIIIGVEGESKEIIDDAEAGISIMPEDANALAVAVEALANDPVRCARLGKNGNTYVHEHYDRKVLAARYLTVLTNIVAAKPGNETKREQA
jgi:glycosyltransferase involved in cell wall biosynthesis